MGTSHNKTDKRQIKDLPQFAYQRTSFIRPPLYAKTLEIKVKDA